MLASDGANEAAVLKGARSLHHQPAKKHGCTLVSLTRHVLIHSLQSVRHTSPLVGSLWNGNPLVGSLGDTRE